MSEYLKLDGASLQDLHHYALAMQGKDCAFGSEKLMERLDASRSAYDVINRLEADPEIWEPMIKHPRSFKSEAELIQFGAALEKLVARVSFDLNIDPHSGEKKSHFSRAEILQARQYWGALTYADLIFYWRHYTTGTGAGLYSNVKADTGFFDYLVHSAAQSAFERAHDI